MSQDKTLHFIGLLSVNDVIPVDFASFRNNISLASVLVDAADTVKKGCICDGRAPSSCRGRENDEFGISRCIIFGSSGTARGVFIIHGILLQVVLLEQTQLGFTAEFQRDRRTGLFNKRIFLCQRTPRQIARCTERCDYSFVHYHY